MPIKNVEDWQKCWHTYIASEGAYVEGDKINIEKLFYVLFRNSVFGSQ